MTINLYTQGFIYILGGADRHHYPKLELAGLSVFFTWVGAVAAAQPSLQMALLWLFVSHAVSGILHVQVSLPLAPPPYPHPEPYSYPYPYPLPLTLPLTPARADRALALVDGDVQGLTLHLERHRVVPDAPLTPPSP